MSPGKSPPSVSVVICSRNRREALAATLQHMVAVLRPRISWELLVVDNGSTDGTAAMLAGFATTGALPIRTVPCPEPGLSRARNAGIRAAAGTIIAMTDDDCRVAPDWIDAIAAAFAADPGVAAIGGRVEPGPGLDPRLSTRRHPDLADVRSLSDARALLMGANLAFRRSVLERIGPFDVRLGAGSPCLSGEDLDMLFRLVAGGHRVEYHPEVVVDHFHDRNEAEDIRRLRLGYLTGRGALAVKRLLRFDYLVAKSVYWELRSLARPDPPDIAADRSAVTRPERLGCVARGALRWVIGSVRDRVSGVRRSW